MTAPAGAGPAAPTEGPGASRGGRIAGAAALIAVLTVASRLAGFGRTIAFGWAVGKNDLGDVYLAANTVPNIVFEIVAGGALASLVVPLLAADVARGDRAAVSRTVSALLTWTLTLLVPLSLLVALLAGPILRLTVDASGAQADVGARMLTVFAPQLPLYGVGIVLTGLLQAHRRFAWPALAPLLSSVTVIGAYAVFVPVAGRGADVTGLSRTGELILSVGTTLGVVVLTLCLIPATRGLRLTLRPRYSFAGAARGTVGPLAAAGVATVAAQQIAVLVSIRLAGAGPSGSLVLYNLAQTMFLLPWAVLAVPLATAAYPSMAAAAGTGDHHRYRATLAGATRAVLLLSCFGAAALLALAGPAARVLVALMPQAPASGPLAAGIAGFAPGLLGYGLFAVLSRALYARGDTAAAAGATVAGWAAAALAALALAAGLAEDQRVLALALGNSAGMLVVGAVLLVVVARRAGPGALAGLGRAAGAGLAAGAVAAGAGLAVVHAAAPSGTLGVALTGALATVAVTAVYLAGVYGLDRPDLRPLLAGAARRLRRTAPSAPHSSAEPGSTGRGPGPRGGGDT
nr:lipid II flippase MurJ [Micromonospora sp. NBRC 107566]